jgi:hypothetical protein
MTLVNIRQESKTVIANPSHHNYTTYTVGRGVGTNTTPTQGEASGGLGVAAGVRAGELSR